MLRMNFTANWRWSLLATTYWILAGHLHCVSPFADVCSQVHPSGSCEQYVSRYYYDAHTRECRHFYWTGCPVIEGQTGNMFETAAECVDSCNGTGQICVRRRKREREREPCELFLIDFVIYITLF